MLLTTKIAPKKACFWPLLEISMSQNCSILPKIHNQTLLNQNFILFSLENIVLNVFSCILNIPIVSAWCYGLPFHSNIETQVPSKLNNCIALHRVERTTECQCKYIEVIFNPRVKTRWSLCLFVSHIQSNPYKWTHKQCRC